MSSQIRFGSLREKTDRDLSWFDFETGVTLSADGRRRRIHRKRRRGRQQVRDLRPPDQRRSGGAHCRRRRQRRVSRRNTGGAPGLRREGAASRPDGRRCASDGRSLQVRSGARRVLVARRPATDDDRARDRTEGARVCHRPCGRTHHAAHPGGDRRSPDLARRTMAGVRSARESEDALRPAEQVPRPAQGRRTRGRV